jgi:hypothetical protein
MADRTFVPTFHPKYGESIKEVKNANLNYDLNFGKGFSSKIESNLSDYTPYETQ